MTQDAFPIPGTSPYGLTEQDFEDLSSRGIDPRHAGAQLDRLRRGARRLELERPATLGDGIEVLDPENVDARRAAFREALPRTTRFVPASGAATRMFRDLRQKLERRQTEVCDQGPFLDQPWPFRSSLEQARESDGDLASRLHRLLFDEGGLASCPKALLPFHLDGDQERTAFEEQVLEAVEFARHGDCRTVRLHLTISPEHRDAIAALEERIAAELASHELDFRVDYSHQDPSTDTLSLTENHCPLRESDDPGAPLVLRPGGHGALLHNLEQSGGDLVLIKNIDNVQPRSRRSVAVRWRAALLGALALARAETFEVMEALEAPTPAVIRRALELLRRFGRVPTERDPQSLRAEFDRPLRICGVVLNQGEPGGGPFWVRDRQGRSTLQIIESAQVDKESHEQQAMLQRSTHFNPVDVACALRDADGDPYRLTDFRDDDTYFVAHKSHEGQPIRALEHPGLWNGGMAHWLTLFVEAPPETFTPVKTVWDLLRPEHQS